MIDSFLFSFESCAPESASMSCNSNTEEKSCPRLVDAYITIFIIGRQSWIRAILSATLHSRFVQFLPPKETHYIAHAVSTIQYVTVQIIAVEKSTLDTFQEGSGTEGILCVMLKSKAYMGSEGGFSMRDQIMISPTAGQETTTPSMAPHSRCPSQRANTFNCTCPRKHMPRSPPTPDGHHMTGYSARNISPTIHPRCLVWPSSL